MRRQRPRLVGAEVNFMPVIAAMRSGHFHVEADWAVSVPCRRRCRPAQLHQLWHRLLDTLDTVGNLLRVAGEFLAERDRRRDPAYA